MLLEMTEWSFLLLFLLSSSVYGEDCVIFDFEKDFNSSFSNTINVCNNVNGPMWSIGRYEDIVIDSPDSASSKFVYPSEELSCSSSYTFEMKVGGLLEVNMYLKALPRPTTDQVTIIVNQEVPGSHDTNVGIHTVFVSGDDFVSGWRTVKMVLTGRGTYRGYVVLLGIAQSDAVILIDSLRYISPSIKEEECIIYENISTSTISTKHTDEVSTNKETTEPSSPQSSTQFDITNTVYESTTTITLNSDKTTIEASEVIKITTDNSNQSTVTYPNEATGSTITPKDTTTSPNSEYESTTSTNNPTKYYTEEITESTTGIMSQTTMTDMSISSTHTTITYTATTTDVTKITLYPETTTTFGESESISTAEDIGSSTTEQSYTLTKEEYSNESPENTTKSPIHRPRQSFWNAFTRTMLIILILILIVITAIVWYYIGKRSSPRESKLILPYFEEPAITLTIPRASKVWTDTRTINRLTTIIKME